jgi:WD40 repeat protein
MNYRKIYNWKNVNVNYTTQKPEILSSSRDRTVRLWDLERGVVVAGLNRAAYSGTEGAGGCTCSLDFSPCGALALTAGGAREVWVWDLIYMYNNIYNIIYIYIYIMICI